MSKSSRRVALPAVLGVSAVAALSYLAPSAFASGSSHAQPRSEGSAKPDAALHPETADAPNVTTTPTGCSITNGSSSPDYGCGKVTVEAQPVAGTYPATHVADPTALDFVITGPIAFNDTPIQGATADCDTGSGGTDGERCEDIGEGSAPDPTDNTMTDTGTWIAGDQYSVALDTSMGSAPAPAHSLIPVHTATFPNCTANDDNWTGPSSGCADTTVVPVYGTYHQVGLHIVNSVTHTAVAKASYDLCSATSSAPMVGSKTCPAGTTVLGTATTNALGRLVFPSVYLGSQNYSVVPTHEPAGYQAAKSQRLEVPVVTTAAEAGTLYQGSVKLTPVKTVAAAHGVTAKENTAKTINAFSGAKHVVGPLTLVKVGKPAHGKVRHSGGTITYTPATGFVGKDTFTYTIRNAVGVTSSAKIVVHVKAKSKHHKG